jgi:hypothetical protein
VTRSALPLLALLSVGCLYPSAVDVDAAKGSEAPAPTAFDCPAYAARPDNRDDPARALAECLSARIAGPFDSEVSADEALAESDCPGPVSFVLATPDATTGGAPYGAPYYFFCV